MCENGLKIRVEPGRIFKKKWEKHSKEINRVWEIKE
jgi:hypothetical protein